MFLSKRLAAKQARFADREELTMREIYQRFFASDGLGQQEVERYWIEVAKLLRLNPARLRPDDAFSGNLGAVPGKEKEDEMEDLDEFFEYWCEDAGVEYEPESIKTLGALIRHLCRGKSNAEGVTS